MRMKQLIRRFALARISLFMLVWISTGLAVVQANATDTNGVKDVLQQVTIKGNVVDETGEPLIGATIIEQGNIANGTVTDYDGNFSLSVAPGATIRISYIGFSEQVIETTGRTTFNIVMSEDTQTLDELIVVGYTTVRKESLTGSLQSISNKKLKNYVEVYGVEGKKYNYSIC